MIIVVMFGVMYLWHIELNAISVVNIIMVRFDFVREDDNIMDFV